MGGSAGHDDGSDVWLRGLLTAKLLAQLWFKVGLVLLTYQRKDVGLVVSGFGVMGIMGIGDEIGRK